MSMHSEAGMVVYAYSPSIGGGGQEGERMKR